MFQRQFRYIGIFGGILILMGVLWIRYMPVSLPNIPESTVFFDRNGERIGEILSSDKKRHERVD